MTVGEIAPTAKYNNP